MTKVFAHTSKVGAHFQAFADEWKYGTRYTNNPSISYGGASRRAGSYKSTVKPSDGSAATSYSRFVARLTSGASGEFTTAANKVRFNGSCISQVASLSYTGGGCDYASGTVNIPSYLEQKTIQDAKIAISEVTANILEDLAQARQTAAMAGDIYNNIAYLVNLILSRKWGKIRKWLKRTVRKVRRLPTGAATAWLVWYYGIKPLVSTLDSLLSSFVGGTRRFRVSKQASDSLDIASFLEASSSRKQGSCQRLVKCVLTVTLKGSSNMSYWRSLGLSGQGGNASDLDAATTAWALVPYSFVVDWLIPVERFLRSLWWSPLVEYQDGYIIRRIYGRGTATLRSFAGNTISGGTNPSVNIELLYFQRVKFGTFPPMSSLVVSQRISPTNLLSAAALIAVRG